MAVITELTHVELEEALEQYEIGTLKAFHAASHGIENTNYFITTQKTESGQTQSSEYVLTLVEELGGDAISRKIMIEILSHCHDLGLPVPKLVRTKLDMREGRLLQKPVLVCSKLKGTHVIHPVREHCGAIGRFLARFHLGTMKLKEVAKPYIRDMNWLSESVESVSSKVTPDQRFLLQHVLQIVESLLDRNDVQNLPQSVIHGDLFRDNALFNHESLTGIVDFYHAGVGYQIYDIAVAMNDWCVHDGKLDQDRTTCLLSEYNKLRPLTPLEESFLCQFLLYGAFAFWLSRLVIAVSEDLPDDYPRKDPEHFENLVDRHLRRPFRIPIPLPIAP